MSDSDVPLEREVVVVVAGRVDEEGRSWNSLYRFLSLSSGRALFSIPCR